MTDPLIAQVAQLITAFVSSAFIKGSEEFGKNITKDLYEKIKKVVKRDKQNSLISKLDQLPHSKQQQEDFENELIEQLSKNNNFSREIVEILEIMSVAAAILETKVKSYKMIKRKHDLYSSAWAAGSENEMDEEWQKEIKHLEKKLYILKDEILLMLRSKIEKGTPADE